MECNDILEISENENHISQGQIVQSEPESKKQNTKEDLDSSQSMSIISNTDYKKMDISQLRALAISKGIDAKKMKKAELLKLLDK